MKIGLYKVVTIVLMSLFLTMLFSSIAISGGAYDPWVDYDESGAVDHMDLYDFAQAYGTTGDPTKNVNVMNFPPNQDVNVTNWPLDGQGNLKVRVMLATQEASLTIYCPAGQYNELVLDTRGYRQVSICGGLTQGTAILDVFFKTTGRVFYVNKSVDIDDTIDLNETFAVQGSTFYIIVANLWPVVVQGGISVYITA